MKKQRSVYSIIAAVSRRRLQLSFWRAYKMDVDFFFFYCCEYLRLRAGLFNLMRGEEEEEEEKS